MSADGVQPESGKQPGAKLAARAGFSLRKWYLDCIADDGEVFIAYAGVARLGGISLHYSSTLVQVPGEASRMRSTLRRTPAPRLEGSRLTWKSAQLGVAVCHDSLAAPVHDTVLASGDGDIEWSCHVPRARAQVSFADGRTLVGLGYAEELTLTLPPWRLPIDELRWGRFLSEDRSLIWIDWRGPHNRQVVFLDHVERSGACVNEQGLTWADGRLRLTFSDGRVLRAGVIGKTALAVIPAVDKLLPVRILMTDERKWVARGVLEVDGQVHRGWVIHEVVRWP